MHIYIFACIQTYAHWADGQTNWRTDQADGWMDGWTDQADGWMDGWTDETD